MSSNHLKVLLSAYACEPGKGSEPGVGWSAARELSDRVCLTVVTRANNRKSILSSGEEWVGKVDWIFWDPPPWITRLKKGSFGTQWFYLLWQLRVAKALARKLDFSSFDVIHHITFGKFWIPSSLAAVGRPFVFGPVGGGERTPDGLAGNYLLQGRCAEFIKCAAIRLITAIPAIKNYYHSASWTFAATHQTEQALRLLGVSSISVLPQSGIRSEDLPKIDQPTTKTARKADTVTFVTASRLIHWKAIDIAIEAAAVASHKISLRLVVLQTGPEMTKLQALANRLEISDLIEFKGRLPRLEDVYHEISEADALVHPALHEAFGQACLESLALGVPVICLNWGGPGIIVDSETGFAVNPGTREQTITRLAQAMEELALEVREGKSRYQSCQMRAFEVFHWKSFAEEIIKIYCKLSNTTSRKANAQVENCL